MRPKQREELSALRDLEQHEDLILGVVHPHQLEHKRVVAQLHDLLLVDDVLRLLRLDHVALAQALEGVGRLRRPMQHELYPAEPKGGHAKRGEVRAGRRGS